MQYNKKTIYIILVVLFILICIFFLFFQKDKENKVEPNKEIESYKILSKKMKEGKLNSEELNLLSKKETELVELQKRGIEAIATKDFVLAIDIFSELTMWNEGSPLPHTQLGWIYELQNNSEGALKEYKKAIELNEVEKLTSPYLGLARLYVEEGKFTEAETVLKKGIEIDPMYSDFYLKLSETYGKMGESEKKNEYIKKYESSLKSSQLITNSTSTDMGKTPEFYLELAREALTNERAWEAEAMVKLGLEIDQNYAEFYNILRIVYEKYHNSEKAKEYAARYEELRIK